MIAFPSPQALEPRILLVDDDRHIRVYLKKRLAFLGAYLQIVMDGMEALEALENGRPHLILSDAVMPRLDGFDLCRQVKLNPALDAIPFVLLTSLSQNLRERALQAGADDYLSKQENDLIFGIRMRFLLELGLRGLPKSPETWASAPGSILVVSKSRSVQAQLMTQLSKDAIKVLGVSSTAEVLEQLETKGADALFIDMEQGPDTLEMLLGNLENHPEFATLPILAMASKAEEEHLAALELRIQDILPKPLDGPQIRHRAKLLLRLARS